MIRDGGLVVYVDLVSLALKGGCLCFSVFMALI